jgi:hypothetical protein
MDLLLSLSDLRKKYPEIKEKTRESFLKALELPILPQEDVNAIKRLSKKPVRPLDKTTRDYIKKHHVYITLTSDPSRLKLLPLMLSLLDTKNVHEIHVNLPRKYRNEISYNKEDIKKLKLSHPKVKVFRPSKDMGPVTKILPTLKRIKDKDAIVISIDDDIAYPKGMVNEHIYHGVNRPDEISTGNGFTFYDFKETKKHQGYKLKNRKDWWPSPKSPEWPYTDIAEGFSSIGYKKRLVDLKMLEKLNSLSKFCKLSDDLTINYTLETNKIKRRIMNTKYSKPDFVHPLSVGEEQGLHVQKPPGTFWDYNVYKYVECLVNIKEYLNQ